tara:strand:+ start:136 stop:360 length:225 start_codon:yes stop_codon:yes gene_type:complete
MHLKKGQKVYLTLGTLPGQKRNALECGKGTVTAVYPDTEKGHCNVKFPNGSTYTGVPMTIFLSEKAGKNLHKDY